MSKHSAAFGGWGFGKWGRIQPVSKFLDASRDAEHEEFVSGLNAGGATGRESALPGPLDASDLHPCLADGVEIRERDIRFRAALRHRDDFKAQLLDFLGIGSGGGDREFTSGFVNMSCRA